LLQQLLYPRRPAPAPGAPAAPPKENPVRVSVTTAAGTVITGALAYRDEFTIALTDANGWYRSWPANQVKFTVTDPLQAHVTLLSEYTDTDMHNVYAYLLTLR
jgi:cytochrome c oxidase cbb3-type subunit 3